MRSFVQNITAPPGEHRCPRLRWLNSRGMPRQQPGVKDGGGAWGDGWGRADARSGPGANAERAVGSSSGYLGARTRGFELAKASSKKPVSTHQAPTCRSSRLRSVTSEKGLVNQVFRFVFKHRFRPNPPWLPACHGNPGCGIGGIDLAARQRSCSNLFLFQALGCHRW